MAISMEKVGWENGTLLSKAKVEVGGTIYEVEPEQYSGSTPVSAENLKAMETNAETAINEVDAKIPDVYSTEEVKTNKVWIDGKPIYRKMFKISITSTDLINVNHGIENIENCWLDNPSFLKIGGTSIPVNYYRYGTNNGIYAHVTTSSISIKIEPTGWINNNAYLTMEYTKTTD